jgi:hypothetical protein
MEAALRKIVSTYELMSQHTSQHTVSLSDDALCKLTAYLTMLTSAGESDPHRLTVCGLTYLRELDGSNDPVKSGFTGC